MDGYLTGSERAGENMAGVTLPGERGKITYVPTLFAT